MYPNKFSKFEFIIAKLSLSSMFLNIWLPNVQKFFDFFVSNFNFNGLRGILLLIATM